MAPIVLALGMVFVLAGTPAISTAVGTGRQGAAG